MELICCAIRTNAVDFDELVFMVDSNNTVSMRSTTSVWFCFKSKSDSINFC